MNEFTFAGMRIVGSSTRAVVECNGNYYMSFETKGDAELYCQTRNADYGQRTDDVSHARAMKKVNSRVRSRENAKGRADAMRSVGMRKTPYGWE